VLLAEQAPAWTRVEIVDSAASTNALVAERAQAGAPEGTVVVAEHQTAGRGRLGRSWQTPPRAALTFSVLVRPTSVPDRAWPWLPLLTGVAVVEGILAAGGPACALKWPNDVMHDGLKLGGLLAERVDTPTGAAAVLGIGLNVSTLRSELPVPTATSLRLAGHPAADRTTVLVHLLDALGRRYGDWARRYGDPRAVPSDGRSGGLLAEYRRHCGTLGQEVRVHLPSGEVLEGVAASIDAEGALVVDTAGGPAVVSAGDVVHVR
jgi:BirA family biotin operon repressor/biotin-[acetyl-CoA-carboxylase] ligase